MAPCQTKLTATLAKELKHRLTTHELHTYTGLSLKNMLASYARQIPPYDYLNQQNKFNTNCASPALSQKANGSAYHKEIHKTQRKAHTDMT